MTPTTPLEMLRTPRELQRWSERRRAAGLTVGLVPTMGALHAGHLSLIRRAVAECDRAVVSIFVNPAQFGPHEDLGRYPRRLESDVEMSAKVGVAAAFVPSAQAMYAVHASTTIHVGGRLTAVLEGAARPGHFDGVALVVAKLLIASRPDRVYFGQKDAQQCAVVARLLDDLDFGSRLVICPVVRDGDGLALSSRNAFLSGPQRSQALAIPRGLGAALRLFSQGERGSDQLAAAVTDELSRAVGLDVDYVAVVDPADFEPVAQAGVKTQIVVAAKMAETRLIDAVRLGVDVPPLVTSVGEGERTGTAGALE